MANRTENAFNNTDNVIDNVCDPNNSTGLSKCSIACLDADFENRFRFHLAYYEYSIPFQIA